MVKINKSKIFLCGVILFWFSQYIHIPHQVNFLIRNHVATRYIGLIIAAYGLTQMLLRIPVGFVADYFHVTKPMIYLGAIFTSLGGLVRFLFLNKEGFLIGNLLSGIASAFWISFLVYYIENGNDEDKNKNSSNIISAMNIGLLIAFITSTFFYRKIGMKGSVSLSFILGSISFLLLLYSVEINENDEESKGNLISSNRPMDLLSAIFDKRVLFFGVLALIQQGIQSSTAMSFSNKIIEDIGGNKETIGIASVIFMASAVFFTYLSKKEFVLNFGKINNMILAFILQIAYLVGFRYVNNVHVALLLQVLPGVTTGLFLAYATALSTSKVDNGKKSVAMGTYQSIYSVGLTIFPIIMSKIIMKVGIKVSYLYLTTASFIAILLLIIIKIKETYDIRN